MTTIVNGICKAVSCIFDAAEIATMMRSDDANTSFGTAIIAARVLGTAANMGACGAKVCGVSSASIGTIKEVELVAKFSETVLATKNMRFEEAPPTGFLNFLNKKIITPIVSLMRIANERLAFQEREYLEMSPEERAKNVRYEACKIPFSGHYDMDGDYVEDTYLKPVPIIEKVCKENLQCYEKSTPILASAEALLKTKALSLVFEGPATVLNTAEYRQLGNWLSAFAERFGRAGARDPFDLLHLAIIPENLHADPVFAAHICPITLCPIRHPVGDPNGITIYERDAILEAIARQGISPITRAPLRVQDLIPQPALQAAIDAHLRFHEAQLRNLMAANHN